MEHYKLWTAVIGVGLIGVLLIATKPEGEPPVSQASIEGKPFAVVELFTSEGCSSCPPADALLGDFVKRAREKNQRIFALAFHVDYWNRLGWKDEYSSADYSKRQRRYAKSLKSNVYTPQMIINGTDQFVGSNSVHARNSIEKSLEQPATASIALSNFKQAGNHIQVDYSINGNYDGAVLNVALVERGIVTDVKRGENGGRKLRHENVVRSFDTMNLTSADGTVTLQVPEDVTLSNTSLIAYVQNPESRAITGAQGMDLH